MKNVLNCDEELVVDQLRLLRHGAQPDLELAALARDPREHVLVATLGDRESTRCASSSAIERRRKRREPLPVLEVDCRRRRRAPAG